MFGGNGFPSFLILLLPSVISASVIFFSLSFMDRASCAGSDVALSACPAVGSTRLGVKVWILLLIYFLVLKREEVSCPGMPRKLLLLPTHWGPSAVTPTCSLLAPSASHTFTWL